MLLKPLDPESVLRDGRLERREEGAPGVEPHELWHREGEAGPGWVGPAGDAPAVPARGREAPCVPPARGQRVSPMSPQPGGSEAPPCPPSQGAERPPVSLQPGSREAPPCSPSQEQRGPPMSPQPGRNEALLCWAYPPGPDQGNWLTTSAPEPFLVWRVKTGRHSLGSWQLRGSPGVWAPAQFLKSGVSGFWP